ncbi:phospholipase DDHD1, putative [Plasmodium gallinaceum]|uniref:Phospholipase DDHD1, putative n=1 Tax=Plasmodium gallinaceum TaxID=5849 RepID=A0A1J1GYV6_PLAGA|nr:phospholipase DDHD1, putative [Plasmodium gallinaceum]CRG97640.1 phospholipase DDHD1, putative [Plasmodium gallinaceum]
MNYTLKVEDSIDDDEKKKKNNRFKFFPKKEKSVNKKTLKCKKDTEIKFYEEEPYLDDKVNDVDYIILIIHGIGSNEELIINQCEDLKNSFKIVKKMWFFDYPFNIHFHIFNWKKYIIDAQIHVFNRININTMTETRKIVNLASGDIICFLHPRYGDYIMLNLYNDINKTLESLKSDSTGRFKNSKICLLGYSLGSAMAYEILNNVKVRISESNLKYNLKSKIHYLFTLGSPLSALLSLYKPEYINNGLKLIKELKFYNIFHGFDPVAFRIEPLIYPKIKNIPQPVLINYWRNNGARYWFEWDKNMHNAKIAIVQNLNDITSAITTGFYKFIGKSESNDENQGTLNRNICYNKCESKDINMFLLKVKENQRKMAIQKRKINIEKDKRKNKSCNETCEIENEKRYELNNSNIANNSDCSSKENSSYADSTKSVCASQDSNSEHSFFEYDISDNSNEVKNKGNNKNSSNNILTTNSNKEEEELPLRYDYQLQEFIMEHYIYPLAVAKSHFNYFIIKDISFFILKELINKNTSISYEDYLTKIEREYNNKALNEKDNVKKDRYLKISTKACKTLEEFRKYERSIQAMSDPFNMKNFKNLI